MICADIYDKIVTPILVVSLQYIYIYIHELIIFVAITVGRGKERDYKGQGEGRVTEKSKERTYRDTGYTDKEKDHKETSCMWYVCVYVCGGGLDNQ